MASAKAAKSYVLLLGANSGGLVTSVQGATEMAGQQLHREDQIAEGLSVIKSQGSKPTAIVLDLTGGESAFTQALAVRSDFNLASVPIIGVCERASDLAFEEAFASGVDDVCTASTHMLGRRLRALEGVDKVEVERSDDIIVVADEDRDSRTLIGRVFRDAGFQVQFAANPEEALRQSLEPSVRVVIVSDEINTSDEGPPLSSRAPKAGSNAAWVINTPPKHIPMVRARLGLMPDVKVTVHDAFQTPATLLFVANDLVNRPAREGRKSERLLYGTAVRFRRAGRDESDVGYMYNISAGGLYVRTLVPPDRWEEQWLEFVPPRTDLRVQLEATTVWTRKYGPAAGASVPPGFGVQITGGSKASLERYQRGYSTFLEERLALKESVAPLPRRE